MRPALNSLSLEEIQKFQKQIKDYLTSNKVFQYSAEGFSETLYLHLKD